MPIIARHGVALAVPLLLGAGSAEALNLCLLNCSCSTSTAAVTFGSYNPLSSTAGTATGDVKVTCQLIANGGVAQIAAYNIALSTGSSGTFSQRTMLSGTRSLAYNLYTDAGMTMIWGDGTGGSQQASGGITVSVLSAPVSSDNTIYAKLPASQVVSGGAYTDSITVTVSF